MLVLTRKIGETIAIDDHIKITVVQIKGKQVRLGIEAPKETRVYREEIYKAIREENEAATQSVAADLSRLSPEIKKTGT